MKLFFLIHGSSFRAKFSLNCQHLYFGYHHQYLWHLELNSRNNNFHLPKNLFMIPICQCFSCEHYFGLPCLSQNFTYFSHLTNPFIVVDMILRTFSVMQLMAFSKCLMTLDIIKSNFSSIFL